MSATRVACLRPGSSGLSGYNHHGCRCDRCVTAWREYHRAWRERTGSERTAHRREQKRRWDLENRRRCACGRLTGDSQTDTCVDCYRAAARAERDKRRSEIARLWARGDSLKEIATALDSSVNSIGVTIVHMRQDGWSLRYRRQPRKVAA